MYLAPNLAMDILLGTAILKGKNPGGGVEPPDPEEEKVSITYKANGGTGDDVVVQTAKGKPYVIPENTFTAPKGKQFVSWNTNEFGTGTSYTVGSSLTPEDNVTLYAIWDEIPVETEKYTVTYYPNGGTGSIPEKQTVDKGSTVTIANGNTLIPPTDKKFKEWNTNVAGTGTAYSSAQSGVVVNQKLDLYAIWVDDLVTITFNSNGGTGSVEPVSVLRNHDQTLPKEDAFTAPEGKKFVEWNTAQPGNGTSYAASAVIQPANNMTLYAIWTTDDAEGLSEQSVQPQSKAKSRKK